MKKYTEKRPWGKFEQFCLNEVCTVKLHYIKPGEMWSLQYHQKRDEFLKIVQGQAKVTLGDKVTQAKEGDEFFVPRKTRHRVEAGSERVKVLEISFGQFEEGDEVRLEDKYGR